MDTYQALEISWDRERDAEQLCATELTSAREQEEAASLRRGALHEQVADLQASLNARDGERLLVEREIAASGSLEEIVDRHVQSEERLRTIIRTLEDLRAKTDSLETQMKANEGTRERLLSEQRECEGFFEDLSRCLARVGMASDGTVEAIAASMAETQRLLERLLGLRDNARELHALSEALAVGSQTDRMHDELKGLARSVDEAQQQGANAQSLASLCQQALTDLITISADQERSRIEAFAPLINLFYHRLSNHPYFGDLLLTLDSDAQTFKVQVPRPHEGSPIGVTHYFSEAQMNVAALSIFLSSALLQGWSSLSTIVLDDPVQHLDDLNACALLDLLRSLAYSGRQIIVTTANMELYKLMLVKCASLNNDKHMHFRAYRFAGVRVAGPDVIEDTPRSNYASQA